MLQFILGVSGTGKTRRVLDAMRARAEGGRRSLLLVPEQFSSSAETMVYAALGDKLCALCGVYSFTSYAEAVLKRYGGVALETLTDAGRVVMVRRAMDGLGDALVSYRTHRRNTSFCSLCADAIKELKTAGASPEALLNVAQEMGEDGGKLHELSLIYAAYEGLLQGVALDPADRLSVAAQHMDTADLCETAVFVDNFDGFTAPQYEMLGRMLEAQQCTVALCCDTLAEHEGGYGLFSSVRHAAQRLRRLAARAGVEAAAPETLSQDLRHSNAPVLAAVNDVLCGVETVHNAIASTPAKVPTHAQEHTVIQCGTLALTPALSVYDECKTVAAQIAALVAAGEQYRDMAVICRLMEPYAAALQYEMGLAGIPYFTDETVTLEHTAPAAFLRAALAIGAGGATSENLLRLLKTGLCGFSAQEIAAAENYAYTWQLRSDDWRAPFTKNPSGFGPTDAPLTDDDAALLADAERVRTAMMPKIDVFLRTVRRAGRGANEADASGRENDANENVEDASVNSASANIVPAKPSTPDEKYPAGCPANELSRALYTLLQAFNADTHTAEIAQSLGFGGAEGGEAVYRTWNTMMALLDEMNALLGEDLVTAQEYSDLLALLLRASDIGQVPQTQNVVILTTADRMRLQDPKHCFVLGVAEGEFPKVAGYSGLLTHTDRESLVKNGIDMPGSYENRMLLEQMFFYKALTAPSQGLYLSAVAQEAGGAPVTSALTAIVQSLAPQPLALTLADKAPTPAAALDLLGARYREDTPDTAALAAALETDAAAAQSLRAMERTAAPQPFAARNAAALKTLIGRSMTLSPTRIEQYYRCRFCYFLQYVLRIRPRKKAELSPLETGSLVHYILEHALREAGDGFAALTPDELRALANRTADAYVAENMPDATRRFAYLIERLKEGALRLLAFLQAEQAQSGFHPAAFEQEIGMDENAVPPLTLRTPDGETVRIVGKIDRVDVMQREGHSYLRVVDYKTGDKTFNLDEVYCGLDTQMLFYLFTLCQNATHLYQHPVASGVLYVQGDPSPKGSSRADAAQAPVYKVDGLVLDDTVVIRGMDKNATGLFVPFTFGKAGTPRATSKLASLETLGNIQKHLEGIAVEMARGLYAGEIDAVPLCTAKGSPCDVCDYRPVCRHESGVHETRVNAPKNAFREDAVVLGSAETNETLGKANAAEPQNAAKLMKTPESADAYPSVVAPEAPETSDAPVTSGHQANTNSQEGGAAHG